MTTLQLDGTAAAALTGLLTHATEGDNRYPLSARVQTLRAILAKLLRQDGKIVWLWAQHQSIRREPDAGRMSPRRRG